MDHVTNLASSPINSESLVRINRISPFFPYYFERKEDIKKEEWECERGLRKGGNKRMPSTGIEPLIFLIGDLCLTIWPLIVSSSLVLKI